MATAEMLGIRPLLDRLPSDLSGGECQRVSIGRALVRQPRVFLFDEPFTNLDAPLRRQLRSELARIQRQIRTTLLFVTHDFAEARQLADRIVVMRSGAIEQAGTPSELVKSPANDFVQRFIADSEG